MEIGKAYAYCKTVIDSHSSTFAQAFAYLPEAEQNAVWAVYAFCRIVDDIVDEGELSVTERLARLEELETALHSLGTSSAPNLSPLFTALNDVFDRYPMPLRPFLDMVEGQRMDVCFKAPQTMEELENYCYYVAGTVGLMLLPILQDDFRPERERPFVSLGIAMQLTNILRDVSEDANRQRIYIPRQLLAQYGVTPTQIDAGIYNDSWCQVAATITERAEVLYDEGLSMVDSLPLHSQFPVLAAGLLYREILQEIRKSEYRVFGVRHFVDQHERNRILAKLSMRRRHSVLSRD